MPKKEPRLLPASATKARYGPSRRRQLNQWLGTIMREMEGRLIDLGYQPDHWKTHIRLARDDYESEELIDSLASAGPRRADYLRQRKVRPDLTEEEFAFPVSKNGVSAHLAATVAALVHRATHTHDPEELFSLGRHLELYREWLDHPELRGTSASASKGGLERAKRLRAKTQPLKAEIVAYALQLWAECPDYSERDVAQLTRDKFTDKKRDPNAEVGSRGSKPYTESAIREIIRPHKPSNAGRWRNRRLVAT